MGVTCKCGNKCPHHDLPKEKLLEFALTICSRWFKVTSRLGGGAFLWIYCSHNNTEKGSKTTSLYCEATYRTLNTAYVNSRKPVHTCCLNVSSTTWVDWDEMKSEKMTGPVDIRWYLVLSLTLKCRAKLLRLAEGGEYAAPWIFFFHVWEVKPPWSKLYLAIANVLAGDWKLAVNPRFHHTAAEGCFRHRCSLL